MNYYEHHLGDYAAATGHLTWDEDMAYTRLLRAYYHHERGIPEGQQYRLARASTPAQRKAVDAVLAEFFVLTGGVYIQKRADEEIARYQDKQAKAKRSAEARWSAKPAHSEGNANASPNAMRTHSEGNALQTPDTRHQGIPIPSVGVPTAAAAAPPQLFAVPTAEPKPLTARERVWAIGVPLLGENGRSHLGKLAKTYGEETLAAVLAEAMADPPTDPKAWVTAACERRRNAAPPKVNGHDAKPGLLDDPTPQWALDAGFPDRFHAENEGCHRRNAAEFRDGRRITQ